MRQLRPKSRMYEITCGHLAGFLVRILPSGKKVFFVRHRVDGRDTRTRIGVWDATLSLEEARRQAMAILAGQPVGLHEDAPSEHRDAAATEQAGHRARRATGRTGRSAARSSARVGASSTRSPEPLQPFQSQIDADDSDRSDGHAGHEGASHEHDDAAPLPAVERHDALPASSRSTARSTVQARAPRPPHPTLTELADRFERLYIDVYLKPASAANYRRHLRSHILPALGERPFDQVSRADARALHASLADRPNVADYVVCVLGSLYTRIIDDWELADIRNPTAGLRRFGSRRRERFLSPAERRAVLAELDAGLRIPRGRPGQIEPFSAWALRLLMLTGQRRDEILSLRWAMVDWKHSCIHYPDTKTGQRSVQISRETIALLREIHEATGSPRAGLVLRGRNGGKLRCINETWDRVRQAVGIADVRLHDLRHSFASDALMAGVPLAIVGELLGHRQASTTKRYAHLADHVVRDALETATQRIVGADQAAPAWGTPSATGAGDPTFSPISDAVWARIAPLVGAERPRAGPPVDLRSVIDGIRWVLDRRARWRELPPRFGTPTTAWRWHKRWSADGTWERVCGVLGRQAE
ncbi:MAG: tyrosine-type recombinase/integrase [Myxococcales bacterium]|nr:tyrosine-type recombinase/integrase [Myxococcales bacterium]